MASRPVRGPCYETATGDLQCLSLIKGEAIPFSTIEDRRSFFRGCTSRSTWSSRRSGCGTTGGRPNPSFLSMKHPTCRTGTQIRLRGGWRRSSVQRASATSASATTCRATALASSPATRLRSCSTRVMRRARHQQGGAASRSPRLWILHHWRGRGACRGAPVVGALLYWRFEPSITRLAAGRREVRLVKHRTHAGRRPAAVSPFFESGETHVDVDDSVQYDGPGPRAHERAPAPRRGADGRR